MPLTFKEYVSAIGKLELLNEAQMFPENITPFVHHELLAHFDKYLTIGGLPAVVVKSLGGATIDELDHVRKEIYISQEEDFFRKEKNLKPHLFQDGTRAVAELLGQPFSLT